MSTASDRQAPPVPTPTTLTPANLTPATLPDYLVALREASRARPTFAAPTATERTRRACRLSRGEESRQLLCFPAPLALCGPQQYARFARPFKGTRDLSVLTIPGFVGKEPLPASPAVAIEDQATAIGLASDGSAPVLVGYSSGGVLAYGMAAHLERTGRQVAAVVLLDSYPPEGWRATEVERLLLILLNSPEWRPYLSETRLTAMAWYTEWLMGWELEPVAAPTLQVTAGDPLEGPAGKPSPPPVWPFPHDAVTVAGNHFTMLQEHAEETAATVAAWLR